jgi:hypothetical protein
MTKHRLTFKWWEITVVADLEADLEATLTPDLPGTCRLLVWGPCVRH